MDIGAMNEKITIQKNTPTVDDIGNHKEVWTELSSPLTVVWQV